MSRECRTLLSSSANDKAAAISSPVDGWPAFEAWLKMTGATHIQASTFWDTFKTLQDHLQFPVRLPSLFVMFDKKINRKALSSCNMTIYSGLCSMISFDSPSLGIKAHREVSKRKIMSRRFYAVMSSVVLQNSCFVCCSKGFSYLLINAASQRSRWQGWKDSKLGKSPVPWCCDGLITPSLPPSLFCVTPSILLRQGASLLSVTKSNHQVSMFMKEVM